MAFRPYVQQRKLEDSSAARRVRRSLPKEKAPDFFREFFEKTPVKMEENPVLLLPLLDDAFASLELNLKLKARVTSMRNTLDNLVKQSLRFS
jgi:hypothetical protein